MAHDFWGLLKVVYQMDSKTVKFLVVSSTLDPSMKSIKTVSGARIIVTKNSWVVPSLYHVSAMLYIKGLRGWAQMNSRIATIG